MPNHSLRTVIAVALDTIKVDSGYIPKSSVNITNTESKVLAKLQQHTLPLILTEECWSTADEIIDFFRNLEKSPEYKSIMDRPDGPLFRSCIDTAKLNEVVLVNFPVAVIMPHQYGKLLLAQEALNPPLNSLTAKAKILKPGEFMGELQKQGRFFVKLVHVGKHDAIKGGTLFELRDRAHNIAFFYEKPEKVENLIQIGDCFAIHAIPARHTTADSGQKHTVFRTVEIQAGTIQASKDLPPISEDETKGRFTKNRAF